MPLAVLPMAPGVELNLGNSLIPVTGVVLLLREHDRRIYWQALQIPAGGDRRDPGRLPAWRFAGRSTSSTPRRSCSARANGRRGALAAAPVARPPAHARGRGRRLLRHPHSHAPFCRRRFATMPSDFAMFARQEIVLELAAVATPALLMAIMLTSSPRQTLLLRLPRWSAPRGEPGPGRGPPPGRHRPACGRWRGSIQSPRRARPPEKHWRRSLPRPLCGNCSCWWPCFRPCARNWPSAASSFPGSDTWDIAGGHRLQRRLLRLDHGVFHQQLLACFVGVVIGVLAVQTGSLLPGILFHLVHNGLLLLVSARAAGLDQGDRGTLRRHRCRQHFLRLATGRRRRAGGRPDSCLVPPHPGSQVVRRAVARGHSARKP